ncbi:MAG: carbamoyltransferase C-terminal domain-containing protein, partial [Thermoanaerobaculia bacterium]
EHRLDGGGGDDLFGLDRLKLPRSTIPAVTHVDGSARVQTVNEEQEPFLCAVLRAFARRTGVPVLLNTSFNVAGEPIVETPADALRCLLSTGIETLFLEEHCVTRNKPFI